MIKESNTEEKIKNAARKLFQQKGYAGTRTRDIAEAAGINLALLNYYFRSKERLFHLIMEGSLKDLFASIQSIMNDPTSSLSEKIDDIVNFYIDLLLTNANIPLFVLSEIQNQPEVMFSQIGLPKQFLSQTILFKQVKEQIKLIGKEGINPLHFLINILSMTIFPFIAKPLIKRVVQINDEDFKLFIEERRFLLPQLIKAMLQLNN
ncbi:TetR family transcriptional regulator [Bacteroidales bacterium]|nr:TetR family transcriptional regulator [Bacteroidales bacterium]